MTTPSVVKEHLTSIVGTIDSNLKQIENNIVQLEMQLKAQKDQRDGATTLRETLVGLLESGEEFALGVADRLVARAAAALKVKDSPSAPAAGQADAPAAGAPQA